MRIIIFILIFLEFLLAGTNVDANVKTFGGVVDIRSSSFNIGENNVDLNEFTIEFWLNTKNPSLNIGSLGSGYYPKIAGFSLTDEGDLNVTISHFGYVKEYVTSQELNDSKWHHVAVTFDNNNSLMIYIDGNEANVTKNKDDDLSGLSFDKYNFFSGFIGLIDEFRIWNEVRTPDEINEYYNKNVELNSSGLVAYYKLDEMESKYLLNSVNDYVIKVSDSDSFLRLNFLGNLAYFNGTDSEVNLSDNYDEENLTVMQWVKINADIPAIEGTKYPIFSAGDNNETYLYIDNVDGTYYLTFTNTDLGTLTYNMSGNLYVWTNVAFSIENNGSDYIAKLYVNGHEVNQTSSSNKTSSSGNGFIGYNASDNKHFKGNIAQVMIFNKALKSDEINKYMYIFPKKDENGLIGYFPLNEGSGDTAYDYSDYAKNGTTEVIDWNYSAPDINGYTITAVNNHLNFIPFDGTITDINISNAAVNETNTIIYYTPGDEKDFTISDGSNETVLYVNKINSYDELNVTSDLKIDYLTFAKNVLIDNATLEINNSFFTDNLTQRNDSVLTLDEKANLYIDKTYENNSTVDGSLRMNSAGAKMRASYFHMNASKTNQGYLKNGTISVGNEFRQSGNSWNFYTENNLTVVLPPCGGVYFEDPGAEHSHFNILKIKDRQYGTECSLLIDSDVYIAKSLQIEKSVYFGGAGDIFIKGDVSQSKYSVFKSDVVFYGDTNLLTPIYVSGGRTVTVQDGEVNITDTVTLGYVNLNINGGTLNVLNTLTLNESNLTQSGGVLNIAGILNIIDGNYINTSSKSGNLRFPNATSSFEIKRGEFNISASGGNGGYINNGTLTLTSSNFYQSGNSTNFYVGDSFIVAINLDSEDNLSVYFEDGGVNESFFSNLQINALTENDVNLTYLSDVYVTKYYGVYQPNINIYNSEKLHMSGSIYAVNNVYNGSLGITGDTLISDELNITGDLSLENGTLEINSTLVVEGNLIQSGSSKLKINDNARVIVLGEYNNTSTKYGNLQFSGSGSYMEVRGDFNMLSGDGNSGYLDSGSLVIGGDFNQSGNSTNFNVEALSVTLNGSEDQHIYFEDPDKTLGHFYNLIVTKPSGNIILDSDVYVTHYYENLTDSELENSERLKAQGSINVGDVYNGSLGITGDTLISDELNITGDLSLENGTLEINSTLVVEGNLIQSGSSKLKINDNARLIVLREYNNTSTKYGNLQFSGSGSYMEVRGDFNMLSSDGNSGYLDSGSLVIGGDFNQSGTSTNFNVGALSVTLNGSEDQHIYFEDPDKTLGHFYNLIVTKPSGNIILDSDVYVTKSLLTDNAEIIDTGSYHFIDDEGNVIEVKSLFEAAGFKDVTMYEESQADIELNSTYINENNIDFSVTAYCDKLSSVELNETALILNSSDLSGECYYSISALVDNNIFNKTYEVNILPKIDADSFEVAKEVNLSEDFGEYNLSVNITDNDENLKLYVLEENELTYYPEELNVSEGNVSIDLHSKKDLFGYDVIYLILSNGEKNVTKEINLTVFPVNDTPELSVETVSVINVNEVKQIIITADDIDNDELNLSVTSSNEAVLEVGEYNSTLSADYYKNSEINVQIKGVNAGDAVLKVSVNDGNVSVSKEFNITVISNEAGYNVEINVSKEAPAIGEIIAVTILKTDNIAGVKCMIDNNSSEYYYGDFNYTFEDAKTYNITCIGLNDVNETVASDIKELNVQPQYEMYHLFEGWNFISLPAYETLNKEELNATFSNVYVIFKYHDGWLVWGNDDYTLNKFTSINSKEGLAVYVPQECDVNIPVKSLNNKADDIEQFYKNGWYLLGLNEDKSVEEIKGLISSQNYELIILWMYDNENKTWKYYSPNSFIDTVAANKGYEKVLNISKRAGFWVYVKHR